VKNDNDANSFFDKNVRLEIWNALVFPFKKISSLPLHDRKSVLKTLDKGRNRRLKDNISSNNVVQILLILMMIRKHGLFFMTKRGSS